MNGCSPGLYARRAGGVSDTLRPTGSRRQKDGDRRVTSSCGKSNASRNVHDSNPTGRRHVGFPLPPIFPATCCPVPKWNDDRCCRRAPFHVWCSSCVQASCHLPAVSMGSPGRLRPDGRSVRHQVQDAGLRVSTTQLLAAQSGPAAGRRRFRPDGRAGQGRFYNRAGGFTSSARIAMMATPPDPRSTSLEPSNRRSDR
jgi:hypothetical protein